MASVGPGSQLVDRSIGQLIRGSVGPLLWS